MSLPKFRAWDKKKNVMLDSFYLFDDIYTSSGKLWYGIEDNLEVMQYTGFKDDFGDTEIYEGDIVDFITPFEDEIDIEPEYWEIKSYNNTFVAWFSEADYKYLDKSIDTFSREIGDWKIKVVGNIYENKELLT